MEFSETASSRFMPSHSTGHVTLIFAAVEDDKVEEEGGGGGGGPGKIRRG